MSELYHAIENSLKKLEIWVLKNGYKGYEPFDGLSSYLKPLTFHITFFEQILQQIVKRSSINIRPILGVKPQESTKGRGYMAWGYCKLYQRTRKKIYKNRANDSFSWLMKNNTKKSY